MQKLIHEYYKCTSGPRRRKDTNSVTCETIKAVSPLKKARRSIKPKTDALRLALHELKDFASYKESLHSNNSGNRIPNNILSDIITISDSSDNEDENSSISILHGIKQEPNISLHDDTIKKEEDSNESILFECTIKADEENTLHDVRIKMEKESTSCDGTIVDDIETTLIDATVKKEEDPTIFNTKIKKEEDITLLDVTINEELIQYWIVKNFHRIVGFVNMKANMMKLLTQEDVNKITLFMNLKEDYQYFLLKLFLRMRKWYKVGNLCEEIKLSLNKDELERMMAELQQKGCVLSDCRDTDPEGLLNNLQVTDIKKIYNFFNLPKRKGNGKKQDLIKRILAHCKTQAHITLNQSLIPVLITIIKKQMGPCVMLDGSLHALFNKLFVLYTIGTTMLKLADLHLFLSRMEQGEIVLPEVNLQDIQLFDNPEAFTGYAEAHEQFAKFESALQPAKNKEKRAATLLSAASEAFTKLRQIGNNENTHFHKKHLTASYLYTKILAHASEHLTKNVPDHWILIDWLQELLPLECHRKHGFCYKQMSLIYDNYLRLPNESATCLLNGLNCDKLSRAGRCILQDRAKSLLKSKKKLSSIDPDIRRQLEEIGLNDDCSDVKLIAKQTIFSRAVAGNRGAGYKKTYVIQDDENCKIFSSVEEAARQHYRQNGYPNGVHCEGALITTIFAVLFWDIIYDDTIPGAFVTEVQCIPYDLYSRDFYKNRSHAIDERLKAIETEWDVSTLQIFVTRVWNEHSHKRSLISLHQFSADGFFDVILCIGRERLAMILQRFVSDIKDHTAGMPDLFLWNVETRNCKFVEVKGAGDTLSMKQKIWLNFFQSINIDCEVCHVKAERSG